MRDRFEGVTDDRDDPAGDFARDYEAGVRDSHHRIAETPSDLFAILHGVSHSAKATTLRWA